jgi:large subunit ribosomal protein L25
MSKKQNLKAAIRNRTGSGRLNQMRREGWLPSIMYGMGAENKNLKVDARTFNDLLAKSSSDNILVNLDIEGVGTSLAFLQAIQHHPMSGLPIHADFRAIDENTEITAHVPLHLEGEPVGVKGSGGLLEHTVHSLEIRCLPNDLPETLIADVTNLEVGDSLHIGELVLPTGVKATHAADVVVAHVAKARVVEEEPVAAAPAKAAPGAKAAPAKKAK